MTDDKATSSKHRIQRQSLPGALADSLRERILNGEFKDGDPLIQEAIAAEYECSRMPVREAFRHLEAAGLIVCKLHKGAVVTTLPHDQIMELFELRAMLESDILRQSLSKMTDEDLEHSEAILSQLEDAYHTRDIAKVGTLNWEFHKSLYVSANRVQTLALIQGINVQTDRYIRLQILLTSGFEDAEREHREILRLCRERNPAAVEYVRQHIIRAGENLLVALSARKAASVAA
ncbi:MAG TPA: GntR family transcriptional regulator [Gemmatimonadaceae bacterium]|jgi:DNA-binding GntR family transcriptional regulator